MTRLNFYVVGPTDGDNQNAGTTEGPRKFEEASVTSDGTTITVTGDLTGVVAGDWVGWNQGQGTAQGSQRITAVDVPGKTITLATDVRDFFGTITPSGTINIKIGGPWEGPTATHSHPFNKMRNVNEVRGPNSELPAVWVKKSGTYVWTAGIAPPSTKEWIISGYETTPGDDGVATIDCTAANVGSTAYVINLSALSYSLFQQLDVHGPGSQSGQGRGMNCGPINTQIRRCIVRDFSFGYFSSGGIVEDCQAIECGDGGNNGGFYFNGSFTTFIRCAAYFSRSVSNSVYGWVGGSSGSAILIECVMHAVADSQVVYGVYRTSNGFMLCHNCDFRVSGAFTSTSHALATYGQGLLTVKNSNVDAEVLIREISTAPHTVELTHMGRTSAYVSDISSTAWADLRISDPVDYTTDPWADADNGNFNIDEPLAEGAAPRSLNLDSVWGSDPQYVIYGSIGGASQGGSGGGGPMPSVSDVRLGVEYDSPAQTGTLIVPAAGDVRNPVVFDVNTTGQLYLPAEALVIAGNSFGEFDGTWEFTGTYTEVGEQFVTLGTQYGAAGNQYTGDVRVPPTNKVESGYAYGSGDTLTGTLLVGGVEDYPSEDDVRAGVVYDEGGLTGNMTLPVEGAVLTGNGYGTDGTEFTGNYDVVGAVNVRDGITYGSLGSVTGSLRVPAESDVRLGVVYDDTLTPLTGNVRVPTADKVQLGYAYDTNDTVTGTLDAGGVTPNYPTESQVLAGVAFGTDGAEEYTGNYVTVAANDVQVGVSFGPTSSLSGNFFYPTEAQVADGIGFGAGSTEFTGTLNVNTNANLPAETEVLDGVGYGAALDFTGNLVVPAVGKVLDDTSFGANGNQYTGIYHEPQDIYVNQVESYGPNQTTAGRLYVPAAGAVRDTVTFGVDNLVNGTCELPIVGDVRDGVFYGTGGTELEGTLDPGAGGTIPSANDVRFGVAVGVTTGLLDIITDGGLIAEGSSQDQNAVVGRLRSPAAADVEEGVQYGDTSAATTGTLRVPAAGDVRAGLGYGSGPGTETTGTLLVPATGRVIQGVGVDNTIGTFVYPLAADVRLDTQYGDGGVEFTGTLDPGAGGTIPSPGDVRLGVSVGLVTGLLRVPAVGDVRKDVVFDDSDSLTGLLDVPVEGDVRAPTAYDNNTKTGTLTVPLPQDVRDGVTFDDGVIEGDLVLPSPNDVRLAVTFDATVVQQTGTVRVPTADKVVLGYAYDANDSVTGTLDPGATGTIPHPNDVRLGALVGEGGTGTLRVPAVGDVQELVAFDANDSLVGTLELPAEEEVLLGVGYGEDGTEFTGTLEAAAGQGVVFNCRSSSGLALGGVTVNLSNRNTGYDETLTSNSTGTLLFPAEAGDYNYTVTAVPDGYDTLPSGVVTVQLDKVAVVDLVLSATAGDGMCVVFCDIFLNGRPVEGAEITAAIRDKNSAVGDDTVSNLYDRVETNEAGIAELRLYRATAFSRGDGVYLIEVKHEGKVITSLVTAIPDQANIELTDLIPLTSP